MAVREGDGDAVGSQVLQAVDWVGRKARLSLFTVGDHRGAGCLELLDGVPDRLLVEGVEARLCNPSAVELCDAFEELARPRDTPDRFGWNCYVVHGFALQAHTGRQGPERILSARGPESPADLLLATELAAPLPLESCDRLACFNRCGHHAEDRDPDAGLRPFGPG